MKPTSRDLIVARAVRDASYEEWASPEHDRYDDVNVTALIESLSEPAEHEMDAETERFFRIGKLFSELWEAGAPWPVRHWTCDKHKVKGCLRCKTTTAQ